MCVPAAYRQTKNQINVTTHVTAGSCYRQVRWKWHVGTNVQNETISHLCALSKLKNWPWPPWSSCIPGHREMHHEKMPHFNKQLAQGCWKLKITFPKSKIHLKATTHITAESCYREVRRKWHVDTIGQKETISHLSARLKLKNWPSPPWSCCIAGHREVYQENMLHFNKQLTQGCWKPKEPNSQFCSILPVILHFANKLFTAVPNFGHH